MKAVSFSEIPSSIMVPVQLLTGFIILLTADRVLSQYYYDYDYPSWWDEEYPGFNYALPDTTPLIINGTRAPQGLLPYQALLTQDGVLQCGGSLITRNFVVTAAHCVDSDVGTNFQVHLGVVRVSEIAQAPASFLVAQDAIRIHPSYNVNSKSIYDIALIQLPEDAPINNRISTIRLPLYRQGRAVHFKNKIGRISGWGLTATNGAASDDLMYADVRITGNALCNALDRKGRRTNVNRWRDITFTNEHLCTRSRSGAGVCFGDSGGPLAVKERRDSQWTLVGVISFFLGESCEDALYGYTFLSRSQQDWISRITGLPIRWRY